MAGQLYLSGLVSGIDSSEWIKKMLEANKASVAQLQSRQKNLETRQQAWDAVRSQLDKFMATITPLRSRDTFFARQAGVTDANVLSGEVKSGAALGSHQVEVLRLAQAHAIASGAVADAGAQLGVAGEVVIAGTTVTVAATDTLYTLRDRINALVPTAQAQVLQVATGANSAYQLVVTAKKTGSANAVSLSETGAAAGTAALAAAGTAGIATATLSDATTAAAGVYRVTVEQQAQYHQVAGRYVADPALESYTGSFQINGQTVTVSGVDMNGLATAISAAGAGVSAAVVTDANGSRLEITSQTMGSGGAVTVNRDGDGVLQGAGVVHADRSWQNEVQAAQDARFSINGQSYVRGYNSGITGLIAGVSLDIAGPGESTVEVDVTGGGVLRSLGLWNNAGTTAAVITAAQDAEVVVDGRRYRRAGNAITDILGEVTLKLGGTGKASLTVGESNDDTVKAVQDFVNGYNQTLDLIKRYASYDAETRKAGILFGDGLVNQIKRRLASLTDTVIGLPDTMNTAAQAGVTTGAWGSADFGRLSLDADTLQTALGEDAAAVARLFGAVRVNVALAAAGSSATASSNTATAADVINGDTAAERWGSSGGGWASAGVPSSVSPEYLEIGFGSGKTIDEVMVHSLGGTDAYPTADNALSDYQLQYWDGTAWTNLATVTANAAAVNILSFAAVTTTKIRLEITGTNGGKPAQVLEVTANQVNDGLASRMHNLVSTTTGTVGISARQSSLGQQIDAMRDRIERLSERMSREEERLRNQFSGLEGMMAKFQSQGSMLAGMLGSLGR